MIESELTEAGHVVEERLNAFVGRPVLHCNTTKRHTNAITPSRPTLKQGLITKGPSPSVTQIILITI